MTEKSFGFDALDLWFLVCPTTWTHPYFLA